MWNIQGFNSTAFGLKSLNTEFQKSIKEMDIIILQETWSRADAITHPTTEKSSYHHKNSAQSDREETQEDK